METDILYKKLRDRIMADPSIGLKYFGLEAEQMAGEDDEESQTYPKPAAILEVTDVEERSIGNGKQICKVEFNIKLICEVFQETSSREPDAIQNKSLDHLALLAAINKRVHKWSTAGISTIGKRGRIIGSVADNEVEHILSYRCTMKDVSAEPDVIKQDFSQQYLFFAENNAFTLSANKTVDISAEDLVDNRSELPATIVSFGSPSNNNITITQINNTTLRVSSNSSTSETITFNYKATNGVATVGGLVIVNVTLKSGISYPPKMWSGQNVIYNIGDDGWRFANGEFERINPENPLYFQKLDFEAPEPFTTLKHPNKFGNHERFSAIDGSQTYLTNNYVLDNLYDCMFVNVMNEDTFNNQVSALINLTVEGQSGFSIANNEEYDILAQSFFYSQINNLFVSGFGNQRYTSSSYEVGRAIRKLPNATSSYSGLNAALPVIGIKYF